MRFVGVLFAGVLCLSSCAKSSASNSIDELNPPSFDLSVLQNNKNQPRRLNLSDAPKGIRVLVFPHLGKYTTPQKKEGSFDSVKFKTTGKCSFYEVAGNTLLPEAGVDVSNLTPKVTASVLDVTTQTVSGPLWVECNAPVTLVRSGTGLNDYTYMGKFFVRKVKHPSEGTIIQVVNWLDFDQYIKGVVPTEMPSSWHIEALKAQAVAARTYAMFEWQDAQGNGKDYDFDDTVQYQAYVGITKATADTDRSVDETESVIITFNAHPIVAYFSADSGGYTEDAVHNWPAVTDATYCEAKKELYDEAWIPSTNWKASFTYAEFKAALVKAGMMQSKSEIENVSIASRFPSGRANEIKFEFSNGIIRNELATDVRFAAKLRSTLFDFTLSKDSKGNIAGLNFTGKGYGHGSGMSQWGAQVYADHLAWDFLKILSFYYTGVDFCAMEADRATKEVPFCGEDKP